MEQIRNKILAHLAQQPSEYVFSLCELKGLGTTWVLRRAVLRMIEAKEVTSLGRGYYVLRQYSQLLGRDMAVSPYDVMAAITRREGTVFLPPDIVFANRYGFTNANSVRREMQIAGRSRKLTIGGINYDLKHMPPSQWKHSISDYGPAYQALRWIGKDISKFRSFETSSSRTFLQRHWFI